jgi:hypothetical protein
MCSLIGAGWWIDAGADLAMITPLSDHELQPQELQD